MNDKNLTITLPERVWVSILNMLGEANVVPRIAFPIIHEYETALVSAQRAAGPQPIKEDPEHGN